MEISDEEAGLDDIGYSDAIGQSSSIALGLFQEEGIETMNSRRIKIMKGRSGEVGQFSIAWDFTSMDFRQVSPAVDEEGEKEKELDFV
jgi:hypothetical protein